MASTNQPAHTPKTHKIGLILCSTRTPRCAPQIASFIQSLISSSPSTTSTSSTSSSTATTAAALQPPSTYTTHLIDLLSWPLPLHTTEPSLPSHLARDSLPNAYANEITRLWSTHILSFDAFIFICPQYNWGYPAAIKNTIDHLYHEWTGKPAMVVSYGGRGGGKGGGEQLVQVLNGVRMKVIERGFVALSFREGEEGMQGKAERGEDLGLGIDGSGANLVWEKERGLVVQAFKELLDLLE